MTAFLMFGKQLQIKNNVQNILDSCLGKIGKMFFTKNKCCLWLCNQRINHIKENSGTDNIINIFIFLGALTVLAISTGYLLATTHF